MKLEFILTCSIVVVIIVLFAYIIVVKINNNIVINSNSFAISRLDTINNTYSTLFYNDLKPNYSFYISCNSLQQFKNYDYTRSTERILEDNSCIFEDIYQKNNFNKNILKEYNSNLNKIVYSDQNDANDINIDLNKINAYERKYITLHSLKPTIDPKISIIVSYTSPAGKKNYHKSYNLTWDNISLFLEKNKLLNEIKNTNQYERNKMSNSLRYDILKRDGFKCCICGRSVIDGVTLHVDHILPVSKGGETIPSNLRTLCNECNSGKSDKYDYGGLN